jgi:hypothetical protein
LLNLATANTKVFEKNFNSVFSVNSVAKNMFWKDKVVFLTGASSGIGEALAVEMAKRGAILGLLARRAELLKELAEKCAAAGGTARVFAFKKAPTPCARNSAGSIF